MRSLTLFFRLWIWFSFRQLLANRWRAVAVLLGIGLGAAVFTSVRLAINASLDSFTESVDAIAGKSDWTVVRPGGRVPESLVADLLKHPAIHTASPLLTAYVHPIGNDAAPFLLIGLDPILDRPLRVWQTESATSDSANAWLDLVREPNTLLMSRKLLKKFRVPVASDIDLKYMGRTNSFRILAVLDSQGLALADAGNIAITDISTMQEFTTLLGFVDRIDILLKPNVTDKDLKNVRSILPPGIVLARPTEAKESGMLLIKAYQLNLSVLSFVSLFVGMFLVYSLISLNATSRRHELSVLRSIGASSQMLFLLFLVEGAFFGIVGWLLAIPLGSFMVRKLLSSVSSTITHLFARVNVDQIVLDPWEILLSLIMTVSISIIAAYQPAREAMRIPPKEAFLMHERSITRTSSTKFLALAGIFLILMVWPLSKLPGTSGIALSGYVATFFLFTGFALLSPWCLLVMGSHLPPVLKRIGGQPAYLGSRYMRDAGNRIAISVGALITAMALFVALVIMVHSFRNTVETWVNQSIRGDIFLQTQMANTNQYRDQLPQKLARRLQSMQDSIELLPYRRIFLQHGGVRYLFEAIDFKAFSQHGKLLFLEGNPKAIMPEMIAGRGVIVSEVLANQTGLRTGDRFETQVGGIELDLPILGVYRDYRTQGGVLHYSLKQYQELSRDRSWTGVRVFLKDKTATGTSQQDSSSREEIVRQIFKMASENHGVEVTLGDDLRREILRIFDETFAITTVLLLIALLVAALGITTTLTVLVLERARELNTLLAVGASFGQIRAMIVWEAVLMVAAGVSLGAGCGFILSDLLIYVINRQSFGWTFLYSVDWPSLLAALPLILITALLASLPASRLVFKQSPSTLLRER